MALIRWEPFNEMEKLFEDTLRPDLNKNLGWDLAVDVYEKEKTVIAEMNLPGIDPEKIDISFEDDYHLHIAGHRQEEQKVEKKNYYNREIRRGQFERIVRLPCSVDQTNTSADYDDGVLKITMPKKSEETTPKIKVNVSKK